MRIISKIKDYYDYLQDWSDDIVFVRKQVYCMSNWRDIFCCFPFKFFYNLLDKTETRQILGLRVGYKLYLFRAKIFCSEDFLKGNNYNWIPNNDSTKYQIEYIGSRFDYEYTDANEPIKWIYLSDVLTVNRKHQFVEEDVLTKNLNNIKIYEWTIRKFWYNSNKNNEYYVPYLGNTVSAYIDAETIYRDVDDFLRAARNDKDCDSKGITDIEKIINHGFDKVASFRNVH